MRLRPTSVLLLVMALALACTDKQQIAKKEYRALRAQLTRISRTPTERLGQELTRLGDLKIGTERIATCRDACLEAYQVIASASDLSREAQSIISSLEEEDVEITLETLEKKQERALQLIEESEAELERAEELKDRCHELLDDLEGEGLGRDRE